MNNELLKKAYELYRECLSKGELHHIYRTIFFLRQLKKIYPNNAEVDSLYSESNLLLEKVKSIKKINFKNFDSKEFMKNNRSFLQTVLPPFDDSLVIVNEKKEEFTDLLNLTFSFLADTSFDLFMLFRKMFKEKRVLIRDCKNEEIKHLLAKRLNLKIEDIHVNGDFMGIDKSISNGAASFLDKDICFIFINRLKTISDVAILVHEIAHIYYFIKSNYKEAELYDCNETIKYEILPRTTEMLFIDYLEKNGMMNEARDVTDVVANHLYYDLQCKNEFVKYRYLIADFISYQVAPLIIEKKISFREFSKLIKKTPFDVMLKDTKDYFEKQNNNFSK